MTRAVLAATPMHVPPPISSGGFNLLPWRQREAARMRRRCLLEWLTAAFIGCACSIPVAGYQAWQWTRMDSERRTIEQSLAQWRAPLAERQRLVGDANDQRVRAETAQQHARPLTRLVAVLDVLASARTDRVGLERIVQHAHETELQATVADEAAAAAWLAHVQTLPDMRLVSTLELKRGTTGRGVSMSGHDDGPLRMSARLAWSDTPTGAAGKPPSDAAIAADERGPR